MCHLASLAISQFHPPLRASTQYLEHTASLSPLQRAVASRDVRRVILLLTERGMSPFTDPPLQEVGSQRLGDQALDQLILKREKENYQRYAAQLDLKENLEDKLSLLSYLRTKEGYMASWEEKDGSYYLT